MAKEKKWFHGLKKKELQHLLDMEIATLEAFKRLRTSQSEGEHIWEAGKGFMPCWECHFIAKKLGLK